jgi:hypothetical protein
MTYAVTRDEEYLKTITNAYDYFGKTQCYATGGYGPEEVLVASDGSLGNSLETTVDNFETPCGSWAVFKLGRYLIQYTADARYGDWMERVLYNGIGAALPMAAGGKTFYYSDYILGGGRKVYVSETHSAMWSRSGGDNTWVCCSGTYPQAVADYHNIIYFRDQSGVYINLFVPSQVTWNHQGKEVKVVQETNYPESDTTTLTIHTPGVECALRFRVPGWSCGATVKVNGSQIDVPTQPSGWATIQRGWKSGDQITIRFPMQPRIVPVDRQHPNRVALMYGPIVLVRLEDPTLGRTDLDLSRWIAHRGSAPEFFAPRESSRRFEPFYRIGYRNPYSMYFDVLA